VIAGTGVLEPQLPRHPRDPVSAHLAVNPPVSSLIGFV
jgi:hypothetical protein